jgi:hypothetical protein
MRVITGMAKIIKINKIDSRVNSENKIEKW